MRRNVVVIEIKSMTYIYAPRRAPRNGGISHICVNSGEHSVSSFWNLFVHIKQCRDRIPTRTRRLSSVSKGRDMKNAILSLAVAIGVLAGPAIAQNTSEAGAELGTLTQDQRDALIAILSGLPRQ